ncbi:translation machinery-associated protein 16 [Oleoguttula sp. CCFEE 5521]
MPSSLQKVQKHVNKKKGAKASALHEFSRDARRLRRAGNRDEKVSRGNKIQRMSNNQWTERTAFFRDQLPDVLHPFETAEIQRLIEEYLARHDEELAELRSERREGRPKSTRQVQLEQAVDVERKEYVSGYWMPDLQDFESLQKMEAWDGEWTGLANLRFARVDSEGRVKASQFPPKGGS